MAPSTTRSTKKAAAATEPEPVAETPAVEPQATPSQETEADLRRKAYTAGMTRLREENLEEFRRLVTEEADKLGIKYTFKPTAEEKAQQQLDALLEANPGLREKLLAGQQ